MHILFIILGTVGDVLPIINITNYLKKYKIDVTIMTHLEHKKIVEKGNITFMGFTKKYIYEKDNVFSFKDFVDKTDKFMSLLSDYQHPFTSASYLIKSKKNIVPSLKNIYNNIGYHFINIIEKIDIVISSNTINIVDTLTEKYKIPLIKIMHFPWFFKTISFPHPFVCCRDSLNFPFNHISNLTSWNYINNILWLGYDTNSVRKKLGLNPINSYKEWIKRNEEIPQIFTVSKYFLGNVKEWKKHNILMSGFIFSNSKNIKVPKKITNLEQKNKKIIYIGFGSANISYNFSLEIFKLIKNKEDYIFILQGKIAKYYKTSKTESSNIVLMKSFPHDILFRYIDLAVVSGGIGTIMTALSLKKPVLVIPISIDHFFNSYILEKKNLGSYLLQKSIKLLMEKINILLNDKKIKNKINKYSENISKENPFDKIKKFILKNKYIDK